MSAPKSILLDNDFLSDVRVRALIRHFGFADAISCFVHLLTRMNDERGSMSWEHAKMLGDMIGHDEKGWTLFLEQCCVQKIAIKEGETISIPRIVADSKNVESKRKQWRDKKRVQRGHVETSPGMSEEEQEQEVLDKKNGAAKKDALPMDPDGLVFMTDKDAAKIVEAHGDECLDYMIASAVDFAKSKPKKWSTYSDHGAFIRNQIKIKQEGGKTFFNHPQNGPGFYPQYMLDKIQGLKT